MGCFIRTTLFILFVVEFFKPTKLFPLNVISIYAISDAFDI